MQADLLWSHTAGADPALDLAREEVLLARHGGKAVLLTWSWPEPVLVLGYGQGPEGIDAAYCRRQRVRVLRRCSGGTGVLHRGDLGASLILPSDHPWASGIRPLYDRFLGSFEEVLSAEGVSTDRPAPTPHDPSTRSPICFEDRLAETLLAGGRKVLGCAQAKRATGTLVHGTLLLRENSSLYAGVFHVSEGRVRAALGPVPGGPHGVEALARKLGEALAGHLGGELRSSSLPESVEEAASTLEADRRGDPRWDPAGAGAR